MKSSRTCFVHHVPHLTSLATLFVLLHILDNVLWIHLRVVIHHPHFRFFHTCLIELVRTSRNTVVAAWGFRQCVFYVHATLPKTPSQHSGVDQLLSTGGAAGGKRKVLVAIASSSCEVQPTAVKPTVSCLYKGMKRIMDKWEGPPRAQCNRAVTRSSQDSHIENRDRHSCKCPTETQPRYRATTILPPFPLHGHCALSPVQHDVVKLGTDPKTLRVAL